jgi:hypothetical protein
MLLEEFRDALAALPTYALYARVEVRDWSGARAPVSAVDYDGGVIRVAVDDVELVSVDEDEDEDEDADIDRLADDWVKSGAQDWGETVTRSPRDEYLSTFRHRARMFGYGCGCGYPLCCVLFFVLVWTPVVRSIWPLLAPPARGVRGWRHTIARRLCDFWVPGRVEYIPCPWHRWRVSRQSAVPDAEVQEGVQ